MPAPPQGNQQNQIVVSTAFELPPGLLNVPAGTSGLSNVLYGSHLGEHLPGAAKTTPNFNQAFTEIYQQLKASVPENSPDFQNELARRFMNYCLSLYAFEVYPAATVDQMYSDLRKDVLRSIRDQVLQFSIPQDQSKTLSSLLEQVRALQDKNKELEDRIQKLESKP